VAPGPDSLSVWCPGEPGALMARVRPLLHKEVCGGRVAPGPDFLADGARGVAPAPDSLSVWCPGKTGALMARVRPRKP